MKVPRTIISTLSAFCFAGAIVSLAGLLISLIYEVVARYAFNAPTIWAYDMASFLTGTLFLLACAQCQRQNSNIRIDAIAAKIPRRTRSILEAAFIIVLLLPTLAVITYAAIARAYSSVVTREVDNISAWGPVVWPLYVAVALALVALWLQCLVSAIDLLRGDDRHQAPETI